MQDDEADCMLLLRARVPFENETFTDDFRERSRESGSE